MNEKNVFRAQKLVLAAAVSVALSGNAFAEEAKDKSAELETITVTGSKTSDLKLGTNSGALGSRPVIDTPFSISTISADDIDARQVSNLQDLFSREASINVRGGTYSGWGETLSVRGLDLDYENNFKINGLSAQSFSGELPYEAFQQVELLKGATGFMYGFSAPGGIVNYTTKKPVSGLLNASLGLRSDSILTAHIDASDRFGTNEQFGARVNLVHEEGDTYVDGGSIDRDTISVSLDAQITDSLYWTMDLIYNDRQTEDMATTLYFSSYRMDETITSVPDTVDGSRNLAAKGSFDDQKNLIGLTALAWRINDQWNARLEYGYTENNTRWLKSVPYIANNAGDVKVMMYDQVFDVDFSQLRGLVEGSFQTGGISHQLVTGASYQKTTTYRNDPNRVVTFLSDYDNLYNPVDLSYTSTLVENPSKMWSTEQKSLFLSDAIEFSPKWSALIGLRQNKYSYGEITEIYASRLEPYEDTATSPTVALMYKPDSDTTLYTSYVESFEEAETVGDTYENAGEKLDPTISKQYEIGVKLARDNYTLTSSLFRIERAAVISTADNYLNQDGVTLYQGLEFNGEALVQEGLSLYANLLFLDASYDKMSYGSTTEGNDVAGTPDKQYSFGANYDVAAMPGLSLNLGAKYYGASFIDSANALKLSSYTLFDANASYTTMLAGKNITLSGAINNLTDKEYWASTGTTTEGIRIGAPRTVSVKVKVDF